jgi:hypothetical protein
MNAHFGEGREVEIVMQRQTHFINIILLVTFLE